WDPEDIHLESVSVETNAVLCSVTISANEVTERIVYIVGPDPDYSWLVKFGGEHGSGGGGHKLFPQSIIVRPTGPPRYRQPQCHKSAASSASSSANCDATAPSRP